MVQLGHRWNDSIVSRVERGDRSVTVDELVALGLILGASPSTLLKPAADVAVGGVTVPRDPYGPWLEQQSGKLWVGEDGELSYSDGLAREYLGRRGLFRQPEEEGE